MCACMGWPSGTSAYGGRASGQAARSGARVPAALNRRIADAAPWLLCMHGSHSTSGTHVYTAARAQADPQKFLRAGVGLAGSAILGGREKWDADAARVGVDRALPAAVNDTRALGKHVYEPPGLIPKLCTEVGGVLRPAGARGRVGGSEVHAAALCRKCMSRAQRGACGACVRGSAAAQRPASAAIWTCAAWRWRAC